MLYPLSYEGVRAEMMDPRRTVSLARAGSEARGR